MYYFLKVLEINQNEKMRQWNLQKFKTNLKFNFRTSTLRLC